MVCISNIYKCIVNWLEKSSKMRKCKIQFKCILILKMYLCVLCLSPSESFRVFYDTHYLYGTMFLEFLKHTFRRICSQIHLLKYFIWGYFFTFVLIYNHCKNGWVSWHLFSIYNIHWVSSPYWPFLFSLSELLLGPILFPVAPPSTVTYFTIRDHSKWNLCFFYKS